MPSSMPCMAEDPTVGSPARRLAKTGFVVVAGEITTETYVDIPPIVRETVRKIGYDEPRHRLRPQGLRVFTAIEEQSPDIARGVESAARR